MLIGEFRSMGGDRVALNMGQVRAASEVFGGPEEVYVVMTHQVHYRLNVSYESFISAWKLVTSAEMWASATDTNPARYERPPA